MAVIFTLFLYVSTFVTAINKSNVVMAFSTYLQCRQQGCRWYLDSHGDSHRYGFGMDMGSVMNPHGSVGILRGFLNGCEIKRKRVKYETSVVVDVRISPNTVQFWATVCKTVRPMVLVRCLSVCLSVLSVTFVHCGQTVGRIKMKLGTQVGLGPGRMVLDGDPAPLHKGAQPPLFSAHICCGQIAASIKMSLGTELGLGPGDFVLDGDPGPPPQKGAPNFRPTFNY